MPIPDFQSIMFPLLEIISDGKEYTIAGTRDVLAERFHLTDEEIIKELPSLASLPIFLAWGMSDPLISSRNLDRWTTIFPNAKVSRFEKVGHFVVDEGEELFATEFIRFLQSTHAHTSS